MSQQTSRIRPILLRKLKARSKKSWKQIARECDVHQGTIKRWLAGDEARIDNINSLAIAVGVNADELILPTGEEDTTDYLDGEVTVNEKQPADIEAILRDAQKAIGSKYRVLLMYVGDGSIKLGIKLHATDAMRLVRAFIQGRLHVTKIIAVSIKSWLPEPLEEPAPQDAEIQNLQLKLKEAISSLSPKEQEILRLHHIFHYPQEKIANIFETTRDHIRDVLHTAHKKILRSLPKGANISSLYWNAIFA